MDADSIIKLATNLPFAVFVCLFLLWRIEPILQELVNVERAELELLRIDYAHKLGPLEVSRVLEKHGIKDD